MGVALVGWFIMVEYKLPYFLAYHFIMDLMGDWSFICLVVVPKRR